MHLIKKNLHKYTTKYLLCYIFRTIATHPFKQIEMFAFFKIKELRTVNILMVT